MNLGDVMEEVTAVLAAVPGMRKAFAYPPDDIPVAPSAYVSYPQSIDFDQTYQRGEDQFTDLPIVVVAGRVVDRITRDRLSVWVAGDGPESIKAAMEEHAWVSCDDLTITSCEFIPESVAGVPYLAAMFKATVVGPGKEA